MNQNKNTPSGQQVQNSRRVKQVVEAMVEKSSLKTDPQGSYTGTPKQPLEVPVQDADDL